MRNNFLTVEDVRHWIYDRTIADNQLEMDLFFSDEEIKRAMRYACISINSIPPKVGNLNPEAMSLNSMSFHMVVYHLYLSRISMLSRNDIDYSVGEVQASEVKRQIENLKGLMILHKEEGTKAATQVKVEANINDGFSVFC